MAAHHLQVRWVGAAVVLLGSLLAGCPDGKKEGAESRTEPARHEASTPAGRRSGVKVPLPEGWTARAASEELLAVGPAGRDVLRIELRPGQGSALPAAEELVERLRDAMEGVNVETIDAKTTPDHALAVLRLSSAADGGANRTTLALLGAKRVANDLFLCSTTPGASEDDVKAAAAACGALRYTEPPRATQAPGR